MVIKAKGRDIYRCIFAGGRRIPYRRWHPPEKYAENKSRVRPFAVVVFTCAFFLFSFLHISRIMFAVASLMCTYGTALFHMHASFKQYNDLMNFRYLRNHSLECHMNDVRKEKI